MNGAYLDHASATPVRKEVLSAMLPYFSEHIANPSTIYDIGSKIRHLVEEQRARVDALIGANAAEIIFTSSGAEANNFAVRGVALAGQKKGKLIIVSSIEHHFVLNSARFLERLGFEATFLPVDEYGFIDPVRLAKAIRKRCIAPTWGPMPWPKPLKTMRTKSRPLPNLRYPNFDLLYMNSSFSFSAAK